MPLYTPKDWSFGDTVDDVELDRIEQGIIESRGFFQGLPVGGSLGPPGAGQITANDGQVRADGQGVGPLCPFIVPRPITVDAILCQVGTTSAGSTIRLALYSSNADGLPSTLLSTATVDGSTAGTKTGTFTPVALLPGIYWGSAKRSNTTVGVTGCTTTLTAEYQVSAPFFSAAFGNAQVDSGTSSSTPSTITSWTSSFADRVPMLYLRRSA